jgi:hypothetical protein
MVPAAARSYALKGLCKVEASEPVHLLTALPHAHQLAVAMKFTIEKKDGRVITMHDAPFVFEEQHSYRLAPEVVLETGDVVTTTCIYDNTSANDVYWGGDSQDEMCYNFATYYPLGALKCEFDPFERALGT